MHCGPRLICSCLLLLIVCCTFSKRFTVNLFSTEFSSPVGTTLVGAKQKSYPKKSWSKRLRKMTPEGYTRVYVGGLNESIKKEDLQMEFEKYGKLNKVWVAFNPPGFAFIEFLNMNEAELACSNMNGTEIMGAKLRVEISRGRGRGGGRGGVGFRGGRGGTNRGYGAMGGASMGYRGSNTYGDYGGSYYAGRDGGNRGRGRYGEDYTHNRGGWYVTRDNYTQDIYGGSTMDTNAEYSTGKDSGTSRYRSRSPASRGSHRHLRECT